MLDGVVYFPTSVGTAFKALDTKSGKVLFTLTNKDVSFSSPAIAGNMAYYGTTDGWLHAVDIKTGKMIAECCFAHIGTALAEMTGRGVFLGQTAQGEQERSEHRRDLDARGRITGAASQLRGGACRARARAPRGAPGRLRDGSGRRS